MHRSGCSYCDASGEFCLPSLRVLSFSAKALKKKKKKVRRRRTTVSSSKQTFANPSKFLWTLVFDKLKMNSSRQLAKYHSRRRSWRYQVDWLAQTTLYQDSQAQTAGWVKRNKKKNPELVPARLGAVKLHFRCCRNILDLVVNKHASITMITVGLVTRLWLSLEPRPSSPPDLRPSVADPVVMRAWVRG